MPTVTLMTAQTTFVSSAQPNNNFTNFPLIYVGTDAQYQNTIGFIRFDLSSIPVTTVDSAILELSVIVKTGASPSPVAVNRVTSPLSTATVTYATQPTYVPTGTVVNVTTGDLYQTVQFDVTALVNQWLSGTFPNYGIALTNADGSTVVQFATNNIVYEPYFPRLVVTYGEVPPTTEISGIQAQLQQSPNTVLPNGGIVKFDTILNNQSADITYDSQAGVFLLLTPGHYYVTWTVAVDGTAGPFNVIFALVADGGVTLNNIPVVTGQVSGDALLTVTNTPEPVLLVNSSGADVLLANVPVQANIIIIKLS